MGIIDYLDYIGVVAFAVSGAVTAIKKRMDYFGILVLAMVTAIGGGVIRAPPPPWSSSPKGS